MQIMHYISIQKIPLLVRLLQKPLLQECTIIFDLEDTLSHFELHKAQAIKTWGRLELTNFARSNPHFFKNKAVGIRVNGLNSGEFENDLDAISEISQIWDLHCIVGPKIDSPEDIQEYQSILKNSNVRYQTFIPLIETVKGAGQISSIVGQAGIETVVYGHYDYSLDAGHWPFFEHDEIAFWKSVLLFIQQVEKVGVRYVHPPIPFHNNEELFAQVWLRLQTHCRLPFGIMTINNTQTTFFNRLISSPLQIKANELFSRSYSEQNKIDLAFYIKKVCSKKSRNFGFDSQTGKFFTPHHYIAALKFLDCSLLGDNYE